MAAQSNPLAHDPTAATEVHRLDHRFIPVRVCDLATALISAEPADAPQPGLAAVCAALQDVIEQETYAFERSLSDTYAAYNPDRDTLPGRHEDAAGRSRDRYDALCRRLEYLLDKANFEHLDNVRIEAAVAAANTHGLRIRLNPDLIEHLAIWVRGRGETKRPVKPWWRPFWPETRQLEVFRRLVVVARLKNEPHVILKMFKDIPIEDVEALLPHAEVEMTFLDRVVVFGGGGVGLIGTAFKIIKMLTAAALASLYLLWVLLVGIGMAVFRVVMGFQRAKSKRASQRTQHLYFQNISNNAATISTLIGMIAQEETKEALLAYAVCQRDPTIDREDRLRAAAERFLHDECGATVAFDVADALETLDRLDLWTDRQRLRVVPPDEAVRRLSAHWSSRRTLDYHDRIVALRDGAAMRAAPPAAEPAPAAVASLRAAR